MTEDAFRWVVAGGVSLAAFSFLVLGAVAVILLIKFKEIQAKINPLLEAAAPITRNVGAIVEDLKPKIKQVSAKAVEISDRAVVVSDRAVEISNMARDEARHIAATTNELVERVRSQASRVDDAIDDTVAHISHTGDAVKDAVLRPVRQIDGFFSGIRTAVYAYARGRRSRVDSATQDEELFI